MSAILRIIASSALLGLSVSQFVDASPVKIHDFSEDGASYGLRSTQPKLSPEVPSTLMAERVSRVTLGEATYIGCYTDMRGERTMEHGYVDADGLTNEACIAFCIESEQMYAGTSNDFSCWCTNSEENIDRHGTSNKCTEKCSGDESQTCGGLLAVSTWTTGYIRPTAVVPEIGGATYLGCYEDKRGERTMEMGYVDGESLTNEDCIDYCRDNDKAFAGTSNDCACWCTNNEEKVSRHGESTQCNRSCAGDPEQLCGGLLAVTAWSTGAGDPILDSEAYDISEEGVTVTEYAYTTESFSETTSTSETSYDDETMTEEISDITSSTESSVPEATTPETLGDATYLGCFTDMRGERTMKPGYVDAEGLTNEACLAFCVESEMMYAGTSNDFSCSCTNDVRTIDRHGASNQCTKPCGGDQSQICGGLLAVTSWSTGYIKPTPTVPETIGNATYVGCFVDKRGERTMEPGFVNAIGMTNEECIDYCRDENKMFAGTENDFSCWCTNDASKISRHGPADSCKSECSGDPTQYCGGLLAVTTWSTGYIHPIPVVPDIPGATYMGCFEDVRGERTMEMGYVDGVSMTNEDCIDYCRDSGKAFAGTSNDCACWCTNDAEKVSRHGETDNCNKACAGDITQLCGGLLAVTAWSLS